MTRRSLSGLALIAALVAGCVDAQPVPLAAGHPGSPQAAAGSVAAVEAFGQYQPAATLALPAAAAPGMPAMPGMDHSHMPGMDHSSMPGMQHDDPGPAAPTPHREHQP